MLMIDADGGIMVKERGLRELLKNAHDHFFLHKGAEVVRLRLWEVREDCLIIDTPPEMSLQRTFLGFIPLVNDTGVYKVEGVPEAEPLADQRQGTIRLKVNLATVMKMNRRRYPRVYFAPPLEAKVTPVNEEGGIAARIMSLSPGGIRVETDEMLPSEKELLFSFEITCDEKTHALSQLGSILYEMPLGGGYTYGIKFVSTSEQDEKDVELIMAIFRKLLLSR